MSTLASGVLGCLVLGLCLGLISGCSCRRGPSRIPEKSASGGDGLVRRPEDPSRASASAALPVRPPDGLNQTPAKLKDNREREVEAHLHQAMDMMRSGNHEGALRVVQRLQQENAGNPHVGMRTSYLKAMLYHRMRDAGKRKEAMDAMLRDMERLQQDPGFRAAHEEGKEGQEMIKLTLEKAGGLYAKD